MVTLGYVGTEGETTARPRRPLIEGRMMRCPRCKQQHDVLQYTRMRMIEEYSRETTPIYKCPHCRWQFAPCIDEKIIMEWLLGREVI